jgi:plasmid stability protein
MPSLTVRNVPKKVYKLLHDSARQHNRSLNGEIVSILTFEADLARRGLELVRTYPALRRFGEDGAKRLKGSRQSAQPKRGHRQRR